MFADRRQAGRLLAEKLRRLRNRDPLVLAVPRGGVPVAFEVAAALGATLGVIPVRKLRAPVQPELAMGAVGEEVILLNHAVVRASGASRQEVATALEHARAGVARQAGQYGPPLSLTGRLVVVVDDGATTGATLRVAARVARAREAVRVILAAPVLASPAVPTLRIEADDVVWVATAPRLTGVGSWYTDFSQTTDADVRAMLEAAAARGFGKPGRTTSTGGPAPALIEELSVPAGEMTLTGRLALPADAPGLVLFAEISGRHDPRNQSLAAGLNRAGFGTWLFDLLATAEQGDRTCALDIELVASRLRVATHAVRDRLGPRGRWLGYLGTDTGTAAALGAAAEPDTGAAAVVSVGGRPELAGPRLPRVAAPTLLIVGGHDRSGIESNRLAQTWLGGPNHLEIVPTAGHQLAESATLAAVTELAGDWFTKWGG